MHNVHSHYPENGLNKQYEQRTECTCVGVVLFSVLLLLKWLLQIWILCALHIPGRVKSCTVNTKCQIVQMSCDTAQTYIFVMHILMLKQEVGKKGQNSYANSCSALSIPWSADSPSLHVIICNLIWKLISKAEVSQGWSVSVCPDNQLTSNWWHK